MLNIDKESSLTLYEQIYRQIRDQILSGAIPEGSMLHSTRDLAKALQVSRNTVDSAYQQLCSEGYVTSKACSGYRVESIETEHLNKKPQMDPPEFDKYLPEFNEQGIADTEHINFQYGRLRFSDFPLHVFRKLINQTLMASDARLLSSYNNRKGELDLRFEIMKYLHESRGVICSPEQIIICSGTLHGISLLSQLMIKKAWRIAMEDPGYDSIRHTFENHGLELLPVKVCRDGIDLEELESSGVNSVYVTPSHQFPTGVVMPVGKRLDLIEWANQRNAYIIEDDYDSELRYTSRPIPSLHSLDRNGRVIYINTFSKAFSPGIRLSFMVLPPTLLEDYQRLFHRYNCPVSVLDQKAICAFMKEGHWGRHLRKACVSNKRRHDVLIGAIADIMGLHATVLGKNAGLHILLEVKNGMTETELIQSAKKAGVIVYPVSGYYKDYSHYENNQVLIGFGSLSETEILNGIRQLNQAWF